MQAELLVEIAHVHLCVLIVHPVVFVQLAQEVVIFGDLRRLQLCVDLQRLEPPPHFVETELHFLRLWMLLYVWTVHFDFGDLTLISFRLRGLVGR